MKKNNFQKKMKQKKQQKYRERNPKEYYFDEKWGWFRSRKDKKKGK